MTNLMRYASVAGALTLGMTMLAGGCGDDEGSTTGTPTSTSTTGGAGGTGGSGGAGGSGGGVGGGQGGSGGGAGGSIPSNCNMPTDIMLGETVQGDTTGGTDTLFGPCQMGSDNEAVYRFTADATGTVDLTLTSSAADLGLYVRTDCEDPDTVVACVDTIDDTLSFKHKVQDGVTYFLVVDGYQDGQAGPFTLEVGATIEVEICDNMMDDNGDNLTDCEDPGCAADMACTGPLSAACGAALPLTPGTPQVGDTLAGTNLFSGSCCGFGSNEVLYSYTPASDQIMSVTMQAATDLGMYLRSSCDDFFSQLRCRDTEAGGTDELLFHALLPATAPVTLFVDGFMPGNDGPFSLTAETADINETEPNDDTGTADAFMMGYTGYLTSGDHDYIAITLPNSADLTVSTAEVFPGDCNTQLMDTEIELFDTDGVTSLDFNEDIEMGNYCSTLTAMGLAAGTYYVRVSTSQMFCQGCNTGYRLDVEMN